MTKTGGLLLSVFIASSMSGWLGCFYLSVLLADRCLLYIYWLDPRSRSHCPTSPSVHFFEPNFGLVYLQLIPRGLPFRIQYTVKSL